VDDRAVDAAVTHEDRARPERPEGHRRGVSWYIRLSMLVLAVVVIAAGALVLLRGEAAPPPSYGASGDPGGTWSFPGEGASGLDLRWRVEGPDPPADVGSAVGGSIVAGDAAVAVADHGLVALDLATGATRWRGSYGRNDAVVVGTDGTIFSGGRDGFGAIDPATGETRWELPAAGGTVVPRAEHSGLLVAVEHDADGVRLLGLSSEDGHQRWESPFAGLVPSGDVTATEEAVVVATDPIADHPPAPDVLLESGPAGPGPVSVIDPTDGRERWRMTDPVHGGWTPGRFTVTTGALVSVVDADGRPRLVARGLSDGEVLWDHDPDVDGGTVAVEASGGDVLVVSDATLTVLDAASGSVRRVTEPPFAAERVAWDGTVAVLSGEEGVAAVGTTDGRLRWAASFDESWVEQVTVGGDVVLVGSADLVALGLDDGEERWRFGAGAGCDVVLWQEAVVATSGPDPLVLEPEEGRRWRRLLLGRAQGGGPARVDASGGDGDGVLIAAAERPPDGVVQGFDDLADDVRWTSSPGLVHLHGRPVIGPGGTVTIAGTDAEDLETTTVVALDAGTGGERWRTRLSEAVLDQHVVGDDRLVLAADGGGLLALSLEDGTTLWERNDRPGIVVATAIAGEMVMATRWAPADEGASAAMLEVRALEDGAVRWETTLDEAWPAYLAVGAEGTVLAGAGEPHLGAWDLRDGTERWRAELGTPIVGGVTVAGSTVHVATVAGLELLDLRDGGPTARRGTDRLVVSAPLPADSQVVVCHADGTVAAYG
jgi:outer membrane protein assembly factor BamB